MILSIGVTVALVAPAQVARAADVTPITPGVQFSIGVPNPGDEVSYSFSATAGQRVTLRTDLDCCSSLDVRLRTTGGQEIATNSIGQFGEFPDSLPSTGTWILTVHNDRFGPILSHATLGLVTDQTQALALGQQTVRTFSAAGTNAYLSFTGTTGDKFALSVDALDLSSSQTEPGANFRFLRPDGSELGDLNTYSGHRSTKVLLDATGTWTLEVDPTLDLTGSIAFTVNRRVDQIVTAAFGTPVTVALTGVGQDVQVRLPGTSAQRLIIQRLASDLSASQGRADPPSVNSSILRTDDSSVVGNLGSAAFSEFALPGTGTYAVLLEPYDDTVGTVQLKITAVSDLVLSASTGQAIPVTLTQPGQNLRYSFPATAGQTLVAALDDLSLTAGSAGGDSGSADFTATLIAPDGQRINTLMYGPVTYAERADLPSTGVYQLDIDPTADSLGTATLSLRFPAVTTARLTLSRATTAAFSRGDSTRYTFTGTTGQRLGVQVSATALTSQPRSEQGVSFRLIAPGGGSSDFYSSDPIASARFVELPLLSKAGTWTLVADPSGSTAGSATFTVRPIVDQVQPIALGKQVTARITVPGQALIYQFQGRADMRVAVDTVASAWTNPSPLPEDVAVSIYLSGPNGEYRPLGAGTPYPDAASATTWAEPSLARLGSTGPWTLVIQSQNGTVGSKTFTLRRLDDISGPITFGQPKAVTLPTKGAWATYTFSFSGTGTLTWSASGTTIPSGRVQLIDPSGSIYRDDYIGTGSRSMSNTFRGDPSGKWSIRVRASIGQTGATRLTLTRSA